MYILKSEKTNEYYIGQCGNLIKRLDYHNNGWSKSTKSGIPWKAVYTEEFKTRSMAVMREKKLKSYKSKKYIEWLISKRTD